MRRLLALTAASLVVCGLSTAAQQPTTTQRATVEVTATPQTVVPGENVTIAGTVDIDAGTPTVNMTVTNVATRNAVRISAAADREGRFSAVYDKTQSAGPYEVVARSPSGRSSGKASFTVAAPAAIVGEIGTEVESGVTATRHVLDEVAGRAATLPDSPPKREFRQRLAALQSRMREFQQALPGAIEAIDAMKEMLQQAPSTAGPMEKYTQQLRDWEKRSRQERARQPALTRANTICEQLERINEGLNLASLLFDLPGSALQIVNNIFFDKFATDTLSGLANVENDNAKFAISQFLKVGVVGGARVRSQSRLKQAVDLEGVIIGMVGDLTQFAVQKLFGASCERFTGTFTASMKAEFSRDLEPWWRYSEELAGMLDLRYPKSSTPGQPIAMTGEFLGVATKYTLWEDAIRVLYPKLQQGSLTFHVRRAPIGTAFHPVEMKLGKAAFNQFPKAFHIPVVAEYQNDRIRVHLQAANKDLDEAAKVVYVFITPLTLLIPAITSSDLPYKDAHFILDHASEGGVIEMPVTSADGKRFVASADRKATSGSSGQAQGQYAVTIKVCNPSCP